MLFTPQCFDIIHRKTVADERFQPGTTAWEITQCPEEQSFIDNGYYWMENSSDNDWMYYKYKLPLKRRDDWLLHTQLELLRSESYGHYGLVWGFDADIEQLNRFTVSADGERCLVMHFQKDHRVVYHRYQKRFATPLKGTVELSILKISNYYYFLVNKTMIYLCEASAFAAAGPYAGYYLEPGLFVRSPFFKAERLTVQPAVAEPLDAPYL